MGWNLPSRRNERLRPTPATSLRMAGIRQKGTKIETAVANILRELDLHYRKNVKQLPGSPDFANRSHRWAVFVNGCFWHHHPGCRKATVPKSNTEFWMIKFRDNRLRDARGSHVSDTGATALSSSGNARRIGSARS